MCLQKKMRNKMKKMKMKINEILISTKKKEKICEKISSCLEIK